MRQFLLLFCLFSLFSNFAYAKKPTIIAVIDTGFGYNEASLKEKHLCKYGHKDFSKDQQWLSGMNTVDKVPLDTYEHGTNIVGIIDKFAGKSNYCFVIIKFYSISATSTQDYVALGKAIKYAVSLKPDVINMSGGGSEFSSVEYSAIEQYLNKGGIFVAAAGNDGLDLDEKGNFFYPAMYDKRIKIVGNKQRNGRRHPSSNYGKVVKYWEVGMDVRAFGITESGTSQATAVHTGKIVRKLNGI